MFLALAGAFGGILSGVVTGHSSYPILSLIGGGVAIVLMSVVVEVALVRKSINK